MARKMKALVDQPVPVFDMPARRMDNGEMWARVAGELVARQATLIVVEDTLFDDDGCIPASMSDLERIVLQQQRESIKAQIELLESLLDDIMNRAPARVA